MMFRSEEPFSPSPPFAPLEGPKGRIRRLYLEEGEMWRSHYRRYFKIAARLLGIGFILGFIFFTLRPDQERRALTSVLEALKDIPLDSSPPALALTIFYHNARASFFAAAAGWIPFLCLPVLDPLFNGAVLGLLVSIARHQGMNVPALIATGIVPHGIFELPAILYVTSIGIHVSVTLGKKILATDRKGKSGGGEFSESSGGSTEPETPPELGELAARAASSFLLVVLPLLAVAAFIEAFVTPLFN